MRWQPVLLILAVLLGVCFSVQFLSQRHYSWGGLEVKIQTAIVPSGSTRLDIPPVGRLTADTHPLPFRIEMSLRHIEMQSMSVMIDGAVSGTFLPDLQEQVRRIGLSYVLSLMIVGALSATAAALMLNLRDPRSLVMAFASGLILVAVLSSAVYASYDASAFYHYRLEGPVAAFPEALTALQQGMSQLEVLRQEMRTLGASLMQLYGAGGRLPALEGPDGGFSLLVVGDIHNNVPAVDFVGGVVASYPVRAVVDLGDLTDWGTPLEARIAREIGNLGVPYLFVPGNHESAGMLEAMGELANVTIIDGTFELDGIRFLGFPDPSSGRDSPAEASTGEFDALSTRYQLEARRSAREEPDFLLAVSHDPRPVQGLVGEELVDVAAYGHTHRLEVLVTEGEKTVSINPGSTGGAGVRGLLAAREIPMTALLLHFDREDAGRIGLRAIDSVTVSRANGMLTIKRELYRAQIDEISDSPD
ncbi:MAG: metallophosphoesterase family protein [Bacillota bacterium]